ncbi:MAG: cob(I)yrinic acid a,c-diamide adenosyltransferase [Thermodesulfobacteriota bacterium]
MTTGLTILFTGNGKGKTTAALGLALRAAGHGKKIAIIQFIKERTDTGEAKALAALGDCIELHVTGSGFSWAQRDEAAFRQVAQAGWRLAREKIASRAYDLIILDELTYLIHFGLVAEEAVLAAIAGKPAPLHLVITGRQASPGLIGAADLVTEMREIKHPFRRGIAAQAGIEF